MMEGVPVSCEGASRGRTWSPRWRGVKGETGKTLGGGGVDADGAGGRAGAHRDLNLRRGCPKSSFWHSRALEGSPQCQPSPQEGSRAARLLSNTTLSWRSLCLANSSAFSKVMYLHLM